MKYVYPAVFHTENGQYLVDVPDLPCIHTFGDDLSDAMEMAADAIEMWLVDAEDNNEIIPLPSAIDTLISANTGAFVKYVTADTTKYRKISNRFRREVYYISLHKPIYTAQEENNG